MGVVQGQVAPGRSATLVVTIANPNSQDILVTSVTGSVTSVTSAGQAGKPACSTSWYQVGTFTGSLPISKNGIVKVEYSPSVFMPPPYRSENKILLLSELEEVNPCKSQFSLNV